MAAQARAMKIAASSTDNETGETKSKRTKLFKDFDDESFDVKPYTSEGSGSSKVQQKKLGGRPPSPTQAYIDAIKAEYPPEMLTGMMKEAYDVAKSSNSWRGMVAVAEFMAAYGLGKPVKRVESSGDSSLADLLAGVDTSKPLLSIGYDKDQYHKLSEQGAEVGSVVNGSGQAENNGDDEKDMDDE
jgi:hypothetical protein